MTSNSPLVSVIIPVYNRKHLVVETLESLISQTYQHWEAIVVDDCSEDDSYSVVEQISTREHRIKLFKRHRAPKGAPTCRNIGIEKSGGDYIMFLDSDDLLVETCLEERVERMTLHSQCDFLVFQSILFKNTPMDWNRLPNILEKNTCDLDRFLNVDYPWNISAMFIKKPFLIKNDIHFQEGLICHQDLEFGIKMIVVNSHYKKFDEIQDVYIRMENSDKLSNKQQTFEYLTGKIDFINTVMDTLHQKNALNNYYNKKIFNLSVYYMTIFLKHKHYMLFLKMLHLLYKRNITTEYFTTFIGVHFYCLKRKYTLFEKLSNTFFRTINHSFAYKNIPPLDSTLAKYHINYIKILSKSNHEKILVIGYPQSGNMWACLLLNYIVGGEFFDMDNSAYTRDAISERRKNGSSFVQPAMKADTYVLKTHQQIDTIEHLSEYFKIICVVRDPKDIIISYYYFHYYFLPYKKNGRSVIPEYDTREEGKHLEATIDFVIREWKTFMNACINTNNVLYVKYEQLHTTPHETIARCLEDIEISHKSEIIDEAIRVYDFRNISGRKKGKEEKHSFFRKGVVGDYKNYLSQKQIEKIHVALHSELLKFGYLHDSTSH
ncbi:glycosyltransferase [candidate division KSB3 bacterium]|uniref:Glycosyltransferase n=1 Tax=candidate division KSB3 bacterium TaxID=2044937 RepID=A0A9D5Q3S2_9BACT|nr:glycosyltransferase [candidate division KSB3 bacterium]